MRVIIFEDGGFKDLYPLTYLRPSYAIKCGAFTIFETMEKELGESYDISLHCRSYMSEYLKECYPDRIVNNVSTEDVLFLNGRFLISKALMPKFTDPSKKDTAWKHGDDILFASVSAEKISSLKARVESTSDNVLNSLDFEAAGLTVESVSREDFSNDIIEIKYPWDIFNYFSYLLERDIMYRVRLNPSLLHNYEGTKIISNEEMININYGRGVKFYPNLVLDCTDGGIVIDDETEIEPFVFIKGPVYIGKGCKIKSGTKIYGPCYIGDGSKISGEISSSIFHSYVNKQHDGFIGNSYICPMVNLGADTVTSNLKNNYSNIKMKVNGEEIDTEKIFLGSIIGDHSKTAINTMLNTGSIIGIFSNIFGGGFPPKEIGSFTWNEIGKPAVKYDIEKALETSEKTMSRRHLELTPAYESLVRKLYEETVV
jgi:UDP-N-acetylglucosamine diphosphorylase/glucosamine-1-phosphate N-acetyltransferase